MRYMLENIPHHQGHLTSDARQTVREGVNWDILHHTQVLIWEEPSRQQTPMPHHVSNIKPVELKKKVDWSDYSSPWPDNGSSMEQGHDNSDRLEPSFRFQTPFRTGKQFLEQPDNSNSAVFFLTPTYNTNLDVTAGLATPSCSNLGDNVQDESQQNLLMTAQNKALTANAVSSQISCARTGPESLSLTILQASKNNSSPGEIPASQGASGRM